MENYQDLKDRFFKFLKKNNYTVSCAESCTGGRISDFITDIPGVSKFFKGSIIAYSNEIKNKILKVNKISLKKFGAVSENTVKQMAINVSQKFDTDIGIAVSGIAGPGGGTKNKPVGTVFICVYFKSNNRCIINKYIFKNDRNNIKNNTVITSIKTVMDI